MIALYRLALGMLPAAVREQYGEQMSVVFADLVHDVRRRRGRYAACRVIVAELGALVFFAWRERRGQKPPPRIDERCVVWQLENEGGRPMFASFLQDLRYAARMLRRTPGFTSVCIATMAIAIGATTAIFSVVNGILIKPLPFPESDRLIALVHQAPGVNQSEMAASPAIYFTYREHNRTFEAVALWYSNTATVTGGGDPEEVQRLQSTHELLPLLRVKPLLGRTFSDADAQSGRPGTVILSYGYWQRRFAGAAAVLGETLVVDGAPHEIIGVLPREFRFLQQQAEILTLARPNRARTFVPSMGGRGVARLKDGGDAGTGVGRRDTDDSDSHR